MAVCGVGMGRAKQNKTGSKKECKWMCNLQQHNNSCMGTTLQFSTFNSPFNGPFNDAFDDAFALSAIKDFEW